MPTFEHVAGHVLTHVSYSDVSDPHRSPCLPILGRSKSILQHHA